MARQIRRFGPYLLILTVLLVLAAVLAPTPQDATAATFSDPWWSNNSPSVECFGCNSCGCPGPSEWVSMTDYDGNGAFSFDVSNRTGYVRMYAHLGSFPGRLGSFDFGVMFRSDLSGETQAGGGAILSFENTVQETVLNQGDPTALNGTMVVWRTSGGLEVTYYADGSGGFYTNDCNITHELTHNSPYKLTDKHGNEMLFDNNGMPDKYTDRNGNIVDFTYSNYVCTGFTDTRGKTWTVSQNADGYTDEIQDPAGNVWAFNYDSSGDMTSIDYPATTDQPSGTSVTFTRDGNGRITDVQDRRGNTTYEATYVGSTGQVDTVTKDLHDITFSYTTGRTDRTDQDGNVHRTHYTGANTTQTDMWISSTAEYVTSYTYSGNLVVTAVYPRGNRVDWTWDGNNNLTERRHRTSNTSTNDPSDIVHTWTYSSNFVASYTDSLGKATSYTRDSAGNVTVIAFPNVTNPTAQTSVTKEFTYNAYGQVTEVTDEEGKETTYSYYAGGYQKHLLQTVEVDPTGLGLETTYTYDTSGNIATITDPRGNATTYSFDALRRLKQKTTPSPLSIDTKYEYDGNDNLVKVEVENLDKDGASVTANPWITTNYTFSDLNQILTIQEETSSSTTRTTTLAYTDKGQRLRVTKPEGNKEKWEYDERDLLAKHIRGETSLIESEVAYAYDDNGNLVTVTDGEGNDTTHTYDLFDRRTKTTDPLGHYATTTYDERGMATQVARYNSSDTQLQRRSFQYDARGRLWEIADLHKDPGSTYSDSVTEYNRYKTGHVHIVTDPRGNDTTYGYDNAWRRTSVEDENGNTWTWTLDANGNPTAWDIEEVHSGGTVTHEYEATYDAMNRRTEYSEIDRTNGSNVLDTTYGYDSRSNMVWMVNAKGDPTRWTFDEAGRMVKKEVALAVGTPITTFTSAIETEWVFDENDRLTDHKDDADNTSSWTYDAKDRVTELEYPDTETVTYVYDDNDNVTQVTDPNGSVIADTFDDNNRRTARSITRGTGVLGTTSETFTYDGLGRMTKAENNDYKVELTYGVIGLSSQVYEEKQSYVGGTAYTKTVTRTWDATGNKITELYPSGLDLDYAWNDINRLSSVSDGTNTIASYTYVGLRREGVTFQNSTSASYTYTGFRGEVERIHHETSGPATIVDLQYGYDDNHDRTYERFGGSSSAGDAFEYDMARRLTTAYMGSTDVTAPSSNSYTKKVVYTMDDDGNRSSVAVTPYGSGTTTTNYTDNNLNQYTAVGGTSRTHDDNGNLTDDGTLDYEYDYRNQIVRVKQSSTTIAEYKYDALGRRVEKDDGSDVRRFIYSSAETVAVYDGSNAWVQDFVFGAVIDEVLMLEQADVLDFDTDANTSETTRSFYHRNALGSVMSITDMNEAEVVNYRYDPYGAVTITRNSTTQSSDPLGNPWMYTGRFADEESGLYYYRARHYSPVTGRFLQRDPLGYAPGPNVYAYANQSPVKYRDPLGLKSEKPSAINDAEFDIGWVDSNGLSSVLDPFGAGGYMLKALVQIDSDCDGVDAINLYIVGVGASVGASSSVSCKVIRHGETKEEEIRSGGTKWRRWQVEFSIVCQKSTDFSIGFKGLKIGADEREAPYRVVHRHIEPTDWLPCVQMIPRQFFDDAGCGPYLPHPLPRPVAPKKAREKVNGDDVPPAGPLPDTPVPYEGPLPPKPKVRK